MPAHYETITHFQRVLTANTVSTAITLPTSRSGTTCILITTPAARTAPVYFLIRNTGDTTEPTTVAALSNGSGSPCVPPGVPVEISLIPSSATTLVLKSTEAGDVTVIIYQKTI